MRKELVDACFDFEKKLSRACSKICNNTSDAMEISEDFADFCCNILTQEEQIELAKLVLERMSGIIREEWKVDKDGKIH